MISPSAPAAIAASEVGGTRLAIPVAWLGSTINGKWLSSFIRATAPIERVLRISSS